MNLKSTFLLSLGIGLMSVLVSCSSGTEGDAEVQPSKPNIVIIYMDDLGYGDLSFLGQSKFQTPNIDKLAARGMVQWPNTCP